MTNSTKVLVNGKSYDVISETDMTQYPNTARYTSRNIQIQGKRGAFYMLTLRSSGSWYMMAMGTNGRRCAPRTEENLTVEFIEMARAA